MSKKIDLSRKDSLLFSLSSTLFDLSRIAISFIFLPLMVGFFQRDVLIFVLVFTAASLSRVLASYVSKSIKSRTFTKYSFLFFLFTATISLYWLYFVNKFTDLFGLFLSICLFTFSSSMIIKIKTSFLGSFFKLKVRYFTYYRFWSWKWFISPLIVLLLFIIYSPFSSEQKYNGILLTFSIIMAFSFLLFLFINFYKLEKAELSSKEYYQTIHYPIEGKKIHTVPSLTIQVLYSFTFGTLTPLIIYYFKISLLFTDIHLCFLMAIGMLLSKYSNNQSYILLDTVKKSKPMVLILGLLLSCFSTSFVLFSNAILVSILYLFWRSFHNIFVTIMSSIILSLPINDDLKKFSFNPYIRWISIAIGILSGGILFSIYSSLVFIVPGIMYFFITFIILVGLYFSPLTDNAAIINEERITGEW